MDFKLKINILALQVTNFLSQLSGKLNKLNNIEAIHSNHDQVTEICIQFNKFDLQLGASDKFFNIKFSICSTTNQTWFWCEPETQHGEWAELIQREVHARTCFQDRDHINIAFILRAPRTMTASCISFSRARSQEICFVSAARAVGRSRFFLRVLLVLWFRTRTHITKANKFRRVWQTKARESGRIRAASNNIRCSAKQQHWKLMKRRHPQTRPGKEAVQNARWFTTTAPFFLSRTPVSVPSPCGLTILVQQKPDL